jgi:hypothetical protein
MTTAAHYQQPAEHARTSALLVLIFTAAALLIGAMVRTGAVNQTRALSNRGVSAEVPAGWLVNAPGSTAAAAQDDNGGILQVDQSDPALAFSARNPLDIHTAYAASLLPAGADTTLINAATARNLQRGQSLNLYRVTDATPLTVSGREGYRVQFAYVDTGDTGSVPTVITGADYYFNDSGQILVLTLETESGGLSSELNRFFRFVSTATVEGGQ